MFTLIIATVMGIVILLTGYTSWKYLLNQNACNMTYSKIERKEVVINTNLINAKLFFYKNSKTSKLSKSNKSKSKTKNEWDLSLSKHPVLFIPGHGGK